MSQINLLNIAQHESFLRIDLDRYARNVAILAGIAGQHREFMAVIKADAYGHGAIQCAHVALEHGASQLAVARVWEGVRLRRAGIQAPILVLGGINLDAVAIAIEHRLTITVGSVAVADQLIRLANEAAAPINAHLKVDTGLHRYGLMPAIASSIGAMLHEHPMIDLEGIYAHFSSADEPDQTPTMAQINAAHTILDDLGQTGCEFRYIHLTNSASLITGAAGRSNMVRAGVATFGLQPSPDVELPEGVLPVMSVHSRLTRSFILPGGEGVSYGLTYLSENDEAAGTVPIGYADGLPRSVSNRGWFVAGGQPSPIRGRVCMDQTVIGLSEGLDEDAEVLIAGDGSSGEMTLDDIARLDGTINYEIATRLSARMPRVFIKDGVPFEVDMPALSVRESL